jgi:chromosome segregation ATPase
MHTKQDQPKPVAQDANMAGPMQSMDGVVDLESTDELPILDVAAYEAQRLCEQPELEASARQPTLVLADESRAESAAVPAAEILRDVEAWIATQEARVQQYEKSLEELQTARSEAEVRAGNLALELSLAQKTLQTALSRINESDRAASDKEAAASMAESRARQLGADLDASAREALSAKLLEHGQLLRTKEQLATSVEERNKRIATLETELRQTRTLVADAERARAELVARTAGLEAEKEAERQTTRKVEREREGLASRITGFVERLQSAESRRGVWEGVWFELDSQLSSARESLAQGETERAQLRTSIDEATSQLAARDGAVAQLKEQLANTSAALEALTRKNAQDQQEHAVAKEQYGICREALAERTQQADALYLRQSELLAAHEHEIAIARAARAELEESLHTSRAREEAQGAHVAELEALTTNLSKALQAQMDSAHSANELLLVRERELTQEQARSATLDAEVATSRRKLHEQAEAARAAEEALKDSLTRTSAAEEQLTRLEAETRVQSELLLRLREELAEARAKTERSEVSRQLSETELTQLRAALESKAQKSRTLAAEWHEVTLELERTRGALEERELQLRRLERYAATSTQVLSRIKVGIDARDPGRRVDRVSETSATLVPLDNSDAPAIVLGRLTTIGRAPESDLCLTESSVSRRHAVVSIGPNGAFIEDLRSVNGVTVNRQRVRHARIADGDVIELGVRRFRFTTLPTTQQDAG